MADLKQTKTASGINIAAAIWLIISPFIFGFASSAAITNFIIVGILVGIMALIRVSSPTEKTAWLSWANLVLGIWLVLSAFMLGYEESAAVLNSVIVGLIIMVMSVWSAGATEEKGRI